MFFFYMLVVLLVDLAMQPLVHLFIQHNRAIAIVAQELAASFRVRPQKDLASYYTWVCCFVLLCPLQTDPSWCTPSKLYRSPCPFPFADCTTRRRWTLCQKDHCCSIGLCLRSPPEFLACRSRNRTAGRSSNAENSVSSATVHGGFRPAPIGADFF